MGRSIAKSEGNVREFYVAWRVVTMTVNLLFSVMIGGSYVRGGVSPVV